METIGSIQRAVRAFRLDHRRGPLPVALRRRVGRLAAEVGEDETRRAVGVRSTIIRRWRTEYGSAVADIGGSDRSFVELQPELAQQRSRGSTGSGLRIEVAGPGGYVVRIEGVCDATEASVIVRGALHAGNGA